MDLSSRQSREVDPEKTSAIRQLAPPQTKKAVRSFLGMASFLRKFVKNFSKIAALLSKLTGDEFKNNSAQYWTEECQLAFEAIRDALVSPPVLAHPDFAKQFTVEVDASDYAVGAMLAQAYDEEKPLAMKPVSGLCKCEI